MNGKFRGFIALELPGEIRQALRELQNDLRVDIPKARWTRPQGIHLTLKFLGDVDDALLPDIKAALDEVAAGSGNFELTLTGTGAFPRLSSPRVLWVGLQRSDALLELQRKVESVIAPLGFPTEKRPFKGHLTLARLKGDRWPEDRGRILLDAGGTMEGMTIPVDRVILFKSDLKPDGAVYTALHVSEFDQ